MLYSQLNRLPDNIPALVVRALTALDMEGGIPDVSLQVRPNKIRAKPDVEKVVRCGMLYSLAIISIGSAAGPLCGYFRR